MKIQKIHIQNYKCFEDITFELNPQFNVFIGDNGKGKTAVLDAVAKCLGRIINIDPIDEFIKDNYIDDIHPKSIRTIKIDGQSKPVFPVKIVSELTLWENVFRCSVQHHGYNKNTYNTGLSTEDIFQKKIELSRNESGVIFPLLAYYGTGRLWGKDEEKIDYQIQEEGIMMAYPDCLNPNVTSKSFFSWYKTLEDEIKKFGRERDKIALKVTNEAICSMIPGWTDMSFSFREDDLIGFIDGEERFFSQLSDGYRNTIGMVADMIYRCIQLNPHLGENVLKESPGVVLIDELDLHLHPNWQKRIVADLKRIFPKVQFIGTTHSPFIVQSLTTDELINLDGSDEEINPKDLTLNKIVTEIMQIDNLNSDDFNKRYELALNTFEILKAEESEPLNLSDFNKVKGFINLVLEGDSTDPVYRAYLKAKNAIKDASDK